MKDSVTDCVAVHFRQAGSLGDEAAEKMNGGILIDNYSHQKYSEDGPLSIKDA